MIDLLTGKARLWVAFWLFPIGIGIITACFNLLIMESGNTSMVEKSIPFFLGWVVLSRLFIIYTIMVCSKNTDWIFWRYAALTCVLFGILVSVSAQVFIDNVETLALIDSVSIYFCVVMAIVSCFALVYRFFSKLKLSKAELQRSTQLTSEESLLSQAKSEYLARNYKVALELFEKAAETVELDVHSQSYLRMCQKRVST